METLLFAGTPVVDEKSAKVLHKAFFGDRFVEKEGVLSTYKPSSEELGD
jgi:hypothetical protein